MNEDEACAIILLHHCNKKIKRDKLRNFLKINSISYHKPGPKNHMKTKKEMEFIVNKLALSKLNEILNSFDNLKLKSIYV